jgi:hypothetical protein
MANFNIDLNINAKGSTSCTKSGEYNEYIGTSKEVDNTDAGTVLLTGSSSLGSTNSMKSAKGLLIKNAGHVGAEILVKVDTWAANTPDTNADDGESYFSYILGAYDFIFLPNIRQVAYSTSTSAASGATMTNVNPSQLSGTNNVLKKAKAVATLGAHIDGSTTDITVSDSDFFKVNDLIQLGTYEGGGNNDSIEIMKVISVDDATGITVERALYGSNLGNQGSTQTVGHASGANIYLPFFNAHNDQSKYTSPKTNSDGRYWAKNFFGYGRTAEEADGIVPGSISGKFYKGGYQELGLSGLKASSDSRLSASTAYTFTIAANGGSTIECSFTTSTNTTLGGTDGVIQKIQDALDALTNATSGNLAGKKVEVNVINGDIRFTSVDKTSTSAIAITKKSSSLFDGATAVGIFPIEADLQQAVPAKLPDDVIYDKRTNTTRPNAGEMFYDDGLGNIVGICEGSINYETGEIMLESAPLDADFVMSANYGSAHSGGNDYFTDDSAGGSTANSILEIKGRSLNQKINTTLDIVVVR